MNHRTSALAIAAFALFAALTAHAQSPDMVADLAARINRERIIRGLVPYALNSDLTLAAQAHASDIARTGNLSHIGSDGSTVFQRVARTGYGSYSWGRRLGENWAWYHSTADAVQKWMESAPHRENILHALYREFGIGIAPNPVGGFVFVVDFGAQPNVLPVFINDGVGSTAIVSVTIVLSDEQVAPAGDTPSTMGHPTQIQISNDEGSAGAKWEQYSPRLSWTLESGKGIRTVYVKFRDALGRTATSSDSITLGSAAADLVGALTTATPTASPTPARQATATRTRTPRPTLRPSPTTTRTRMPTLTEVVALSQALESETPTLDPQISEQALLSIAPSPTELTVPFATPPDVSERLNDGNVDYSEALPLESPIDILSVLVTAGLSDIGKMALAVFAMATPIGIMAIVKYGFGRKRTDRD